MGYPDEDSLKRSFSDVVTMLKYKFRYEISKNDLKRAVKLINDFRKKSFGHYRYCKFFKAGYTYSITQQLFVTGNPLLKEEFLVFSKEMNTHLSDIRFEINQCKKIRNFIKSNNEINTEEIEELIKFMERNSKERFNNVGIISNEYNSQEYHEQIEEKVKLIMHKK